MTNARGEVKYPIKVGGSWFSIKFVSLFCRDGFSVIMLLNPVSFMLDFI